MDSPDREIYRDPDVVRADDRMNDVVRTDTARKMLSIFRQMEENASKEELPDGPKPLKRFTPPPEDKFAKATASDSEEDEEEEGEESDGDDSTEEKDPNYVRASDKVCARLQSWFRSDSDPQTELKWSLFQLSNRFTDKIAVASQQNCSIILIKFVRLIILLKLLHHAMLF